LIKSENAAEVASPEVRNHTPMMQHDNVIWIRRAFQPDSAPFGGLLADPFLAPPHLGAPKRFSNILPA